MKQTRFSSVADSVFYASCALFFCFAVTRYYGLPLALCVFTSIFIALAMGILLFLVLSFQGNRRRLSRKETERKEKLMLHLALEKPEKTRAALLSAFLANGDEAATSEDGLIVNGKLTLFRFTMEPLSADEAAKLVRKYSSFRLLCNGLSERAEKLLRSLSIEITDGAGIYSLFQETDAMPKRLILGNLPRKTVKQRLQGVLSKSNARTFFLSGSFLLLMSLFTLFPLYYLVTGCVLLFCSVLLRFFGRAAA